MLNLGKRRTKIVCTIGPATQSEERVAALIDSGMNVARINFSHGTHEQHASVIRLIRDISRKKQIPVAILQDLSGPKIRIDEMKEPVFLKPGDHFTIFSTPRTGDATGVSTNFPALVDTVSPGDTILLADGAVSLSVIEKKQDDLHCRVLVGGMLSSHKGINLPERSLPVPSLTEKDKADLLLGLRHEVDYIALSFVRCAKDIFEIKDLIADAGASTPVIAKIEKHEAIDAIDEIIEAADGVMVARGDLAVETPLERAPLLQKMIIEKSNMLGRPVITATQMLKSMVEHPRPTRAEATDVANAVFDGTDAVMLSEETAVGKYPIETVQTMHKILVETDQVLEEKIEYGRLASATELSVPSAVSYASVLMADQVRASAIVTPTVSGTTARKVAGFRPRLPVVALSPNEGTVRQLSLIWGVYPFRIETIGSTDEVFAMAKQQALASHFSKPGDKLIITAGVPLGTKGTTNLIKVEEVD